MCPISQDSRNPIPGIERKIALSMGLIVLAFLFLLINFWKLQVLHHSKYQNLADNNRIRLVDMPATRGIIKDRNGVIVADSSPTYSLAVIPKDMSKARNEELEAMAKLLNREPGDIFDRVRTGMKNAPYRTVLVFDNLDDREVALFDAERDRFPGAVLLVKPRRFYPFGTTASHLLGYVGEISSEQLASGKFEGARKGDMIGELALEKVYDKYFRGKDGGRQVEVDARGREINILGITEPVPGADAILTIDIRLQRELEEALGENHGAGVLIDIRTGEILAMVSRPGFDPNEFSLRLTRERWNEIIKDPSHPLQSRALRGVYPPGSTFKVVTAVASLMEETLDPDETLVCLGGYRFGRRTYRDWKRGGHGEVDLHRGIVESCDVYFYQAGEKAGIEALSHWAFTLGLGKKTGVDLPEEVSGLIPTPDWKKRVRNMPWYPGETLSAAIGQGFVLVTPLQLANLYATVARRGTVITPHLVKRIVNVHGDVLHMGKTNVSIESEVPDEVWDRVIEALTGVVADDQGTGRAARIRDFPVAGKTGTAQVVRLEEWLGKEEEEVPLQLRDHAWFAAFAPVQTPQVAAAVIVEHGGHGASAAAPVVARIFRKYIELNPDAVSVSEVPGDTVQ
ncbi:penicillin-binding protein 2 [bacterium]|nr:MAG: penicillin-binding protein 2 [bacterium]